MEDGMGVGTGASPCKYAGTVSPKVLVSLAPLFDTDAVRVTVLLPWPYAGRFTSPVSLTVSGWLDCQDTSEPKTYPLSGNATSCRTAPASSPGAKVMVTTSSATMAAGVTAMLGKPCHVGTVNPSLPSIKRMRRLVLCPGNCSTPSNAGAGPAKRICRSPMQSANAPSPMVVTVSGTSTPYTSPFAQKENDPMFVTSRPSMVLGIRTFPPRRHTKGF